jgi:UDP-glucose 4-epimerase
VKCCVTGVAGFLCSHVAEHLVNAGYEVIGIDDLSGGFQGNVPDRVRFLKASILNHKFIDAVFEEQRFDFVFHLAAYAAENLSHFIKRFNYENNVIGSVNLINAAVNTGVKKFVFTSSIAVYGNQTPPFHERITPQPCDSYGIAKYAVETELRLCYNHFGLDYIIFRPHNIYGPRQNLWDKYRNVVAIFINQALVGKPMTIYGDGKQQRAFSYIDDVAPIIAQSVEYEDATTRVFNIGGDSPCTVNELAAIIAKHMEVEPQKVYLRLREEVYAAWCDHNELNSVFKHRPQTPLLSGIAKMVEWAKAQKQRQVKFPSEIEIQKNMPEGW